MDYGSLLIFFIYAQSSQFRDQIYCTDTNNERDF